MGKLYFKIGADYEKVIKLREEIEKLKQTLLSMNKNRTPDAVAALEVQLGTTRQKMDELVISAAKAGAAMDNDFKSKIYQSSQSVNDFTQKIINQKAVVKDVEADVRKLGESYRVALKNNPLSSSGKLSEYTSAKKALDEEKASLFGLTQEQANARLSVKKIRDEYALYKNDGKQVLETNNGMAMSFGKVLGVIGGVSAIKQLGSEIIRVRGEFQSMQTAIETLVGKDMAGNLIPKIKELAKISPLTLTDMVGAEKMMLGFNIKAEDTIRYLQALGDISMGNSQKFNSLTLAFSQMSATGKLMGQDLNQMINAGFNPLQQIAQSTGKSISTLKEEMSKGAISTEMVQKAFIDATSAGGKFFGMSENASKTINGQLSMMQDALHEVFNELGTKGEGVIMTGIKETTSLIQNYETVGKIISGLVVTYGTYRTAIMLSTIATGKHTIAEVALTNVRVIARRAQMALNASMLTNPYVALAVVIGGLITTMWAMSDSTTAAARAQKEYNDIKNDATQKEKEHKQKIEDLLSASRDESLATLTRQKSLEELRKEYPKIFEKYDIEKLKLDDILELKRQINEEDSKRSVEGRKEDYSSLKHSVSNQQRYLQLFENSDLRKNMSDSDKEIWKMFSGKQSYVQVREQMDKNSELLKKYQKDVLSDNIASYKTNLKNYSKEKLEAELKMAQSSASKRNGFNVGGMMVKGSELEGIVSSINGALSEKKSPTTYKKDLDKAKKDWESAKAELKKIEDDKSKFTTKQYEDAKKRSETSEKAYKDLGGIIGSSLTKQESAAEKLHKEQEKLKELKSQNAKDLARKLEDLYFGAEQAGIDAMDEGSEKTLAQMELNHEKELLAIDRERNDLVQAKINSAKAEFDAEENIKATNNPNYNKQAFDSSSIGLSGIENTSFDNKYKASLDKQAKDRQAYYDAEKQSMNEYLASYGDYMQKRNAIIAKGEERKKDKNNWEKKSIDEETKKLLAGVDDEVQKKTSIITQLFSDMSKRTVANMRLIADQAQQTLDYVNAGEFKTDDSGKGLFGLTKEQFDILSESPEKLESIKNEIANVRKEADASETALNKLGNGLKKVFSSGSDTKKFQEGLAELSEGMNSVMQAGQFLSDSLSELSDAFGNDTLSGIAEGINVAMDAMGSAMDGAKAGAAFGPWGAAAGAAIGMVTSLASSFAKIHDTKNEKRIQRLQEQIDALDRSYNVLGYAIDKAYSSDASKLIGQQNTLLEQQKQLIQNQILEEESKKKSDSGKIQEYKDRIDEIDKTIVSNKEEAIDAIFGEDIKSAIDNFASAYADAWTSGEDKAKSAKDTVKDMMRQMVTESIKAAIQSSQSMEKIRAKLQEFYADGILSGWEQDYIYQMSENLQEELDRKFGWADGLMKDEDKSTSQSSTKGAFETMSQDTGNELNGRFTALQLSNEEIKNQNILQNQFLNLLTIKSEDILLIGSDIKDIAGETRDLIANSYLELVQISENTGAIVKPIQQMQKDIAEVKKNTSKL